MYTDKVLKYFHKPINQGKIRNPDGVGKVGNIACGDMMYLYIKM
ncbi:MAG: iron-sulfur cluster assembly scaffold protein, partial [Patescibacteria group bacterium]